MVARRVFWVLLCLIAGGPCAFLALERIGVPIVALVLVGLIVIGRRNVSLAETLIAFGLTYAIEIFHLAAPNLVVAIQEHDLGAAAYSAAHLIFAAGILLSGCWILVTRSRNPRAAPQQRGGRANGPGAMSGGGR